MNTKTKLLKNWVLYDCVCEFVLQRLEIDGDSASFLGYPTIDART